jgi:hypothetical protein
VWPECDPCDDPLVQQALQPAEPVNRLPLQLSVLPSNMPAELLMTYQGEVSRLLREFSPALHQKGVIAATASCYTCAAWQTGSIGLVFVSQLTEAWLSACCMSHIHGVLCLQELSRRMQKGADGEDVLVWQLQGVTAGERLKGLAVRCVDEVGRPATAGVKGKVQVRCTPHLAIVTVAPTPSPPPALPCQCVAHSICCGLICTAT